MVKIRSQNVAYICPPCTRNVMTTLRGVKTWQMRWLLSTDKDSIIRYTNPG